MKPCNTDNVPLEQRQKYPLELKIAITKKRIQEWYEHFNGQVYVAFSGGKDSTVLLHLVRSIYPEVPAVFVDTGLEFPEIREFVKTIENVVTVRPKMAFTEVIREHGYPIISKEQSSYIAEYRNSNSDKLKDLRWNGRNGSWKISERWKYLVDAPFKISSKCCDIMKKEPFHRYNKESGRKPIVGAMAYESDLRLRSYRTNGCNAFDTKKPISKPLSFWIEKDIWEYISTFNIEISEIYKHGYERTGCMFCLFGHHISKTDRLDLIKKTHPQIHKYMIEKLGLGNVLAWYPKKLVPR